MGTSSSDPVSRGGNEFTAHPSPDPAKVTALPPTSTTLRPCRHLWVLTCYTMPASTPPPWSPPGLAQALPPCWPGSFPHIESQMVPLPAAMSRQTPLPTPRQKQEVLSCVWAHVDSPGADCYTRKPRGPGPLVQVSRKWGAGVPASSVLGAHVAKRLQGALQRKGWVCSLATRCCPPCTPTC